MSTNNERYELNKNLAQMLKGGVIMDVTTPEQAKIAEAAGACAVMALERIPADIRAAGGVSRMSDPKMIQGIQDAGLSHTGIPCKGRQLPGDQGLQFLDPLPGLRADPQSWKSGGCVNGVQRIGTVQIAFVQQHHHAASFQCCDGRHPVNEERVCFGDGTGGDDHQLVDVGHRRPGKCVLPGQDGLHKALAVPQLPDLHPVPHQRGDALLPKLAPGPAGEHLAAGVHIVEAAEGLSDPSLTHRRSPHGYCSHPSRRPHTPPRRPFRCLSAYRGGCPVCSPPIH